MKVIGKTNNGFLCEMKSEELNRIATGMSNPDNFSTEKSMGSEISISRMFESVRRIESYKLGSDYMTVRRQLEDLLEGLKPIEGFIELQKQDIAKIS